MKKIIFTPIALLFFLFCAFRFGADAAVPHLINYQGRLTDTSGAPLNGSYNLTFRIYDAETAGNLLWEETHSGALIQKGIFGILLGSIKNLDLPFDKPYFLEIKVGADEPMTPRQQITASAYAIRAERLVDEPLPTARGGTGATAAANTANGVVVLDASGFIRNSPISNSAYAANNITRAADCSSYADMADMSVTITTAVPNQPILVYFSCNYGVSDPGSAAAASHITFAVNIAGNDEYEGVGAKGNADDITGKNLGFSTCFRKVIATPGTTTIKIRWKAGNSTAGISATQRTLVVSL